MAKRSNFARRKNDEYETIDPRAVRALMPYLINVHTFAEPCCGHGLLIDELERHDLVCKMRGDIQMGSSFDGRWVSHRDVADCDAIITNPPWTRQLLHPLIRHFMLLKPTWLLFDSDWAFNKHASPYLPQCSDIVAVGRLRWIEGTTNTGKDNVSWYRFWHKHYGPTRFHGREMKSGHRKTNRSDIAIHTPARQDASC